MNTDKANIKKALQDQIERVWSLGEVALVDSNYTVDVIDHMPIEGQPTGRDALKDVVKQFRSAIPDLSMTLHGTLAAGEYGVDVWTLSGTHSSPFAGLPASGADVNFSGIDMVRVEHGRIAELWHVEELAHFERQIGASTGSFGTPSAVAAVPAASQDPDYQPGRNAIVPGEEDYTALERRNLGIARRHIEEIWARGRSELCYEMYHPDVVDHNPAPDQRPGIDGIVDVLGWLREAVPDLRMNIACYIVDEDWIADRWVMTGTHDGAPLMGVPAQGRTFRINGMDVARLDGEGLITDIWHCEEFASLLHQVSD